MKEKIVKPDPQRGIELLFRLLRLYPFDISIGEQRLNSLRNQNLSTIMKNLWFSQIFDLLDQRGYQLFPPYSDKYFRYNINDYYRFINDLTRKLMECLHNVNKKPKDDIYLKTRDFMILQYFFRSLYYFLAYKDESGGWDMALENARDNRILGEFYSIFGISPRSPKDICKSNIFISKINEILKELGFEAFSLSNDGYLRYFGVTMESEEKRRVYDLLSTQKYNNVIEDMDKVYEHISNRNYSDALSNCRKAQESFFKRFLLNHKIKTLYDGKKTEDGTVSNLAETLKQNITNLFDFPKYSKNIDTKGFYHLLESSKFIISGLANPAASHGKSTPPNITLDDVKVASSFLIMMINTLLPFGK